MSEQELYGYVGFDHKGKRWEGYATSLYGAKLKLVKERKVPKKQEWKCHVHLAERPDGSQVVHTAVD